MCWVFACGGERRHAARSLLRTKQPANNANNANGLTFPSKVVYFQIRVHWRDSRVSLFSTRLGSTRRFEVEDFVKQIPEPPAGVCSRPALFAAPKSKKAGRAEILRSTAIPQSRDRGYSVPSLALDTTAATTEFKIERCLPPFA